MVSRRKHAAFTTDWVYFGTRDSAVIFMLAEDGSFMVEREPFDEA